MAELRDARLVKTDQNPEGGTTTFYMHTTHLPAHLCKPLLPDFTTEGVRRPGRPALHRWTEGFYKGPVGCWAWLND